MSGHLIPVLKSMALLAGTTIGAGILAVPYVVAQSGYWIGVGYLLAFGLIMIFINLCLAETSLRTEGYNSLPDLVTIYFGKRGNRIIFSALLLTIYGALTAYMIGSGNILYELFGQALSPQVFSLMFFTCVAIAVYFGLKTVSQTELLFVVGIIILIVGITLYTIFSDSQFYWDHLDQSSSFLHPNTLLPYGTVLFAYFGFIAVPEMKPVLGKYASQLKTAIIFGFAIPITIYLVFTTIVIGLAGSETNQVATVTLGRVLGTEMMYISNIFGLIAMFTSALALGIAATHTYQGQFSVNHTQATILTMSLPLLIILANWGDFVEFISLAGAVTGGILGITIILLFWRAKERGVRTPEFSLGKQKIFGSLVIGVLILGTVLELIL